MPDFVTCGRCGLRHTLRPDGICPKCKNAIGAAPAAYDASAIGVGAYAAPANFRPGELEGSYGLGCVVTLIFGLGALIVFFLVGKPATKTGAKTAFIVRLVVAVPLVL